jgi:hypothetical protein
VQNFIADPETGRNVATIRDGEVFRDDEEQAKIATVRGSDLYDLDGKFLCHLDAGGRALPPRLKGFWKAVRDRGQAKKQARR